MGVRSPLAKGISNVLFDVASFENFTASQTAHADGFFSKRVLVTCHDLLIPNPRSGEAFELRRSLLGRLETRASHHAEGRAFLCPAMDSYVEDDVFGKVSF
jgi:hypothetical protein